jgi:hypothetical protein
MSTALNLSDELVKGLSEQARRRDLSWQQWAILILDGAVSQGDESPWRELNGRRLELIHAKYDRGLDVHEERELAALQAAADQRLAVLDRGRLEWLENQERRAEKFARAGNE